MTWTERSDAACAFILFFLDVQEVHHVFCNITELSDPWQSQWPASHQDFMMSRSLGGGPSGAHSVSKDT